jgi:hypothetical protein
MELRRPVRKIARKKIKGPSLGIESPKGRVPLVQPRRDRTMGSSILASLSEAGGNDPFLPMSGPLPPHSSVGADRVGTRPTPSLMQVGDPFERRKAARLSVHLLRLNARSPDWPSQSEPDSGFESRNGFRRSILTVAPCSRPLPEGSLFAHTRDRNLFAVCLCRIIKASQDKE